MLIENDFEAVLVNFCCYEYGTSASETVQKISTRTLLELCQLTKTANFKVTPMKKHLAVYHLLIGDTRQVSVFFLINKNEQALTYRINFNHYQNVHHPLSTFLV